MMQLVIFARVMSYISVEEMAKIYEIVAQTRIKKMFNGLEMTFSCSSLMTKEMARLITGPKNRLLLQLFLEELIIWNYDETNAEMIERISSQMNYATIAEVLTRALNVFPSLSIAERLSEDEEKDEKYNERQIFAKNKREL